MIRRQSCIYILQTHDYTPKGVYHDAFLSDLSSVVHSRYRILVHQTYGSDFSQIVRTNRLLFEDVKLNYVGCLADFFYHCCVVGQRIVETTKNKQNWSPVLCFCLLVCRSICFLIIAWAFWRDTKTKECVRVRRRK